MDVSHTKIENTRNSQFEMVGYAMTIFFICSFLFLFIYSSRQLDFWKEHFYGEAYDLGSSCLASGIKNNNKTAMPADFKETIKQPTKIPHRSNLEYFSEVKDATRKHVYYLCNIDTHEFSKNTELTYLHTSWLFGDHSAVYIDNKIVASFSGNDKPSIPLSLDQLKSGNIKVEFISSANLKADIVGLQGAAPTVIASGQSMNFKIFGIETALQNVRYLINVLPLLTLSLVLTLGWFFGIRSRLILTVFIYFTFAILRNFLLLFSDILPWDTVMSYNYSTVFLLGVTFSLFIFGCEFIRLGGRFLSSASKLNFLVVTGLCVSLAMMDNPNEANWKILNIQYFFTILGSMGFIAAGFFKLKTHRIEEHLRKPTAGLMVIFSLLGLSSLVDKFQLLGPVSLHLKIDVLMPFAIGGFIFYVLKLIQDKYNEEKERRRKIELDLELAKEIQDSMSPPPPQTKFGEYVLSCYQIKHSQVAGDWMAVRPNGKDELLVVIADVTGKGIQAALVVHAIQSLWAEALGNPVIDPAEWIHKVNRTLFTLGEQKPHSATLGLLRIKNGSIEYFCMGHPPLFIVETESQKVHSIMSKGSILGISKECLADSRIFSLENIGDFHVLLGTDGVFDKGSRTKPREVKTFLEAILTDGKDSLIDRDDSDDRTLFHLHNDHAA